MLQKRYFQLESTISLFLFQMLSLKKTDILHTSRTGQAGFYMNKWKSPIAEPSEILLGLHTIWKASRKLGMLNRPDQLIHLQSQQYLKSPSNFCILGVYVVIALLGLVEEATTGLMQGCMKKQIDRFDDG